MKSSASSSCPDDPDLARFLGGEGNVAFREGVEDHLASCETCRRSAGLGLEAEFDHSILPEQVSAQVLSRLPVRPRLSIRRALIAASVAGLLVLTVPVYRIVSRSPQDEPGDPGIPRVQAGQIIVRPGPVRLPDGTVLRIGNDTELRFDRPVSRERARLELVRGTVEAWVAQAPGEFRIAHPAGTVRVLGTHFKLNSAPLRLGGRDLPVAVVELYAGKLSLENGQGRMMLQAGERGLLLGGKTPARQALGRDWMEIVTQFEEARRTGREDGVLFLAATFWGADWGAGWDWRRALQEAGPGSIREGIVALAGMSARPGIEVELARLHRDAPGGLAPSGE